MTGFNPGLIEYIKSYLNQEPYRAYEFSFSRERVAPFMYPIRLNIKPFNENSLDEVLTVLDDAFTYLKSPDYSYLSDKENFRNKFSQIVCSRFEGFYLNDEMVGFYFHHNAEIEFVAVSGKYQNQHYGSEILKRANYMIKKDSEREPHLYCVNQNQRAALFYLREGFTVSGRTVMFQLD